jgi:hypothetical protein
VMVAGTLVIRLQSIVFALLKTVLLILMIIRYPV